MLLTHLLELKWNHTLSKNFNFSEIKGLKLPKLGKIDLQFAFLHFRILRTTQDFFKALFDFNHTKINLRTLYGPIVSFISYVHMFSWLYTKISSLRPKTINFAASWSITPINLCLYGVLTSKLQLILRIWRSSSWVWDFLGCIWRES